MKELVAACALLLTMLIIYLSVIQSSGGVKEHIQQSNSHVTDYVRGIDS